MRVKVPVYAVKGVFCSIAICVALMFVVFGLVRAYVARVTYPAYMETVETGPGSVGSAPREDTPRAASLEELRQYDRFAPVVLHYKAMERVGGRQYYALTLPSGEVVIGHMVSGTDITPAGTTESGEPLYQLPVSRWDAVEVPAGEAGFTEGHYDDVSHFVECVGQAPLSVGELMERNAVYQIFQRAWVVLFLLLSVVFSLRFRRRAAARRAAQQQ